MNLSIFVFILFVLCLSCLFVFVCCAVSVMDMMMMMIIIMMIIIMMIKKDHQSCSDS